MIKNGKDLKKYRQKLKLSQKEFSELFGLKRSTLSCYECGSRKMSKDVLTELNDSIEYYESWQYEKKRRLYRFIIG